MKELEECKGQHSLLTLANRIRNQRGSLKQTRIVWCKMSVVLKLRSCALEKNPEKAVATHSSSPSWKIPWTEESGGLQSMGSRRVGHDWATSLSLFTFIHWRRNWQPTPIFLPGESQGQRNLVGCRLWGCRVGHDWCDLAAAAEKNRLSLEDFCGGVIVVCVLGCVLGSVCWGQEV